MSFESLTQQPPAGLSEVQLDLAGVRMGRDTAIGWVDLTGLDEMPDVIASDVQRPTAHGVWAGDDYTGARTISWDVEIQEWDGTSFGAALAAYRRVMVPRPDPQDLVPLWSFLPDRGGPIRWDVRVRRHRVNTDLAYTLGVARAAAQLSAPDPVGYGPGGVVSTAFAQQSGGLQFDLFTDGTVITGSLEFGPAGSTGRNRVDNAGTAPLWVAHRITGPTPDAGFEVVDITTGRRLRYVGVVPAGSVLDIDTGEGSVTLDGVADRTGLLTVSEWTPVPAGGSTEFAFLPLSAATSAVLETAFASAWW